MTRLSRRHVIWRGRGRLGGDGSEVLGCAVVEGLGSAGSEVLVCCITNIFCHIQALDVSLTYTKLDSIF
jgi:hypothetical protein